MDEKLTYRLIGIIKVRKLALKKALLDHTDTAQTFQNVPESFDSWMPKIAEYGLACAESVRKELGPVFDRSYESEEALLKVFEAAFSGVEPPMGRLIDLLHEIRSSVPGTPDEETAVGLIAKTVEKVLIDLLLFFDNLEDVLLENPEAGAVTFTPDIGSEVRCLHLWSECRNRVDVSNLLWGLAAAFGVGYIFGDE